MENPLDQLNEALGAVVECVRPNLVHITSGRHGRGAGVVWHVDGLIVTNAHVIRHHAPHVTLADARTFPARVLATDPNHDLAVLSIAASGLPAIKPSTTWPLQPGEWVLALGHPWGVMGAATAGIVIDVGATLEMPWVQGTLIQTSLHLRPGHSGGPLVDVHARLVGINTMTAGPNVGLAVPLPVITSFVRRTLGYEY
jgi:S1-C subfamily serine protease